MRKLILVLVIVLALALSGCGNDDRVTRQSLCSDSGGSWYVSAMSDEKICIYDNYYTQEEIDNMNEMFGDLLDELDNHFLNIYTEDEIDEGFEDVLLYIQALEKRIEELENAPLDIIITHGTMNGVISYGDDGYVIVAIGDTDYECISMYEGSFFWYEDLTVVIINDIYYTYPTRIN